jgi:hypothetical protein
MAVLAELQIHHSRSLAPTRRVALGRRQLPIGPRAWMTVALLRGVVARSLPALDHEQQAALDGLLTELAAGGRVSQPRVGYRFQADVQGLDVSAHRLVVVDGCLGLDIDEHGDPVAQILGAVYAAAALGAVGDLCASGARGSVAWAAAVLGVPEADRANAVFVQRRLRSLLRQAHPDSGADAVGAARRITDLVDARRILLDVARTSRSAS